YLFFSVHLLHLVLHSFPTRRSSDLVSWASVPYCTIGVDELLHLAGPMDEHEAVLGGHRDRIAIHEQDSASMTGVNEGSFNRQSRSEEHTSELQSRENLVCRLLLEKK